MSVAGANRLGQLGGDWNIGKTMGKPWENHRKTMGKPRENHGKTMGKPWENHGKMVIYMERSTIRHH